MIDLELKNKTDKEVLNLFMQFLDDRVSIVSGFLQNEEDGQVTHQFIRIQCGELETVSAPQEMEVPLQPVTPSNIVVN